MPALDLSTGASWLRGWLGLGVSYAAVQVPLAAGMLRRGARLSAILASPLVALPLTVATGIGLAAAAPWVSALGSGQGGAMPVLFGIGASVCVGYGAGLRLGRSRAVSNLHQRGARVETGSDGQPTRSGSRALRREAQRARGDTLTLAGLSLTPSDETKHFKLIGTTGTGKSTAIRELLAGALKRGDRAIIADPDGGYLQRFRREERGDVVLNPFEATSLKWDLFGEIEKPYDVDQLARSLIPEGSGSDRSWLGYARTFFTAVATQAHAAGTTDLGELYRLLVVADCEELRRLVEGTPAQPFLEPQNGRMFDSIRSVTSSAVGALEYVAEQQAAPLSIRQWVRQSNRPRGGILFMPYRASQIAALRSTVSAWMRLAIFEAMNQPEGDQRLWFIVDELDALGQIDGLKDALARLRKFGGRCVLGLQSIAQVSSTYGTGESQTIVENCGNTLILRCSGSEHGGTAHFASRLIGQRQVLRTQVSRSRRPTEVLSSKTVSQQIAIEPAVMDAEIEQLPDLGGYLKIASRPEWRRITLDSGRAADTRSAALDIWRAWRNRHRPAGLQGVSTARSSPGQASQRGGSSRPELDASEGADRA